jgi:hypothetical protein
MQNQFEQRMQMSLLLREIDECRTIGEILDLVKREHIIVPALIQQGGAGDPSGFVPESLRIQVREAAVAKLCGGKVYRPPSPDEEKDESIRGDERQELIREVEECETIDKLFEIVRDRHIVIQMKSQNAASNIPFEPLPENPELSPLDTLRSQVRDAVDEMFRDDDRQELIREVQTCPTIDKLFEIVRDRHIVIQMKSQNSASCLPQKQFSEEELMPDTTPLERLRQQVLEAILYG